MGDSVSMVHSSKNSDQKAISKKLSKNCLVASTLHGVSQKTVKYFASMGQDMLSSVGSGDIGIFVLKTASLEIVRRFAIGKWPFVWHSLQAMQIFCYPPFNWIQRWTPFKALVRFMQTISRPLLVLTIATVFSDQSASKKGQLGSAHDSQLYPEAALEPSSSLTIVETRPGDEIPQNVAPQWLQELHKELEKQGISLPHRLNEDEIFRFYTAAKGDFSRLLSSIKKTIHWRQNFTFLSPEELEAWSHLVFWHGYDVQLRPSLIIRLGLACSKLRFNERNIFAKAVVSQIECGITDLVDVESPQITVLMDCEGLSPFGFPMKMMRSCSILMQDHYPNRLGYLIVVRLPPVARVITQTLFRVLQPTTQQKLRIVGEDYEEVLSEFLQTLPSFLGGTCSCIRCSDSAATHDSSQGTFQGSPSGNFVDENSASSQLMHISTAGMMSLNADQTTTIAIISILVLWMFIGFLLARRYPDSFSFLFWRDSS